ncbi:MAG TPA: thioredoxin domain-containing protein [Gemmatimonadaceae bacterium]|nr:thioredoxin domain-containing protein [Gemmatimonadaceae bacterium]
MAFNFDRVLSSLLTLAAIAVAAVLVKREFFSRGTTGSIDEPPQYVPSWTASFESGHKSGEPNAPVRILELSDFECPFCRRFDSTLKVTEIRFPHSVQVSFVHFPLPMHRFAVPAARAAECAANQGTFAAMHDVLFAQQDSLGLKSWNALADEAGVPDTVKFGLCLKQQTNFPPIDSGKAYGERIGVHGTPTVIINGWRLPAPPTPDELASIVQSIEAGKSAFAPKD